ncbi:MAG TPA: hypothetical protein VMJ11_29235, partial [Paraburkholderia sp.]|uniref:hypothetical protein n=1 Tax=Paraburkholderia sp. TaxID=1926495 RepID=UPI002C302195
IYDELADVQYESNCISSSIRRSKKTQKKRIYISSLSAFLLPPSHCSVLLNAAYYMHSTRSLIVQQSVLSMCTSVQIDY